MSKTRSTNVAAKGRSPKHREDRAPRSARLTTRQWAIVASGIAVLVVAVVVGWSVASTSVGAPGNASDGTVVQAVGGHWTNVTPAKLTSMLRGQGLHPAQREDAVRRGDPRDRPVHPIHRPDGTCRGAADRQGREDRRLLQVRQRERDRGTDPPGPGVHEHRQPRRRDDRLDGEPAATLVQVAR